MCRIVQQVDKDVHNGKNDFLCKSFEYVFQNGIFKIEKRTEKNFMDIKVRKKKKKEKKRE
jgi:hypothetical protein